MLSSRARYACRALVCLTQHYGEESVQVQQIADEQNIPKLYLQQILMTLRAAGFVVSRKGRNGGYYLARHPREITLGSVLRAMDGPLAPISCVSVTQFRDCGCPDPETCGLRKVFAEVRDRAATLLDSTTFEDLGPGHPFLEEPALPA